MQYVPAYICVDRGSLQSKRGPPVCSVRRTPNLHARLRVRRLLLLLSKLTPNSVEIRDVDTTAITGSAVFSGIIR